MPAEVSALHGSVWPELPAHGFSGWRRVNLLQHAADPDQVVVEDLLGSIEQLEYAFIAYGVIDVGAFFASHHDIPVAQHCELLRSVCGLDGETLADLVDCQLALTQRVEAWDSPTSIAHHLSARCPTL